MYFNAGRAAQASTAGLLCKCQVLRRRMSR
jgi:hypothetical protein